MWVSWFLILATAIAPIFAFSELDSRPADNSKFNMHFGKSTNEDMIQRFVEHNARIKKFQQGKDGGGEKVGKFKMSDAGPLNPRPIVTCGMCYMAANTVLIWIHEGATKEDLVDRIVTLCVSMNVQKEHICRGIAEAHADMAIWIVKKKKKTEHPVTAEELCGFALFPQCPLEGDHLTWTLDLEFAGAKPALLEERHVPEDVPSFKVLHLTDVHVDPQYSPGSNAACDEPVCCRKGQTELKDDSEMAGYWGDYRDCDTPMHAFKDMIKHAANHKELDYVMFTGDIIDHFVWATSKQLNTETIKTVMEEMKQAFQVPILPIIGNHEAHPVNVFSGNNPDIPPELSTTWLYELAAEMWMPWMTEGAKETVLKGGYYSHEVKPGLVVIAINNNFCYPLNWWLVHENKDPADQLKWLAEQLLHAEKENKKVHILAHIPSGSSSCWNVWSREYRRILHRFENTVVAQFHGHTHNDHFNLFYDLDDPTRATSVAFVGGGATAYSDVNPNYRIYSVEGAHEGSTFRVLDHETWYFNLTEANLGGPDTPPRWEKLYNFKEAFGLHSLQPKELDNFVHELAKYPVLQEKYFGYYVKMGDQALQKGCDEKCKKAMVCEIVTTVHGEKGKCETLPFESARRRRDAKEQIDEDYLDFGR